MIDQELAPAIEKLCESLFPFRSLKHVILFNLNPRHFPNLCSELVPLSGESPSPFPANLHDSFYLFPIPFPCLSPLPFPFHEGCVLVFKCLRGTGAPALGDGLRSRVGENVLFSLLEAIEDGLRHGLGRSFRYIEAAAHVGIHWAREDRSEEHTSELQSHVNLVC